jgi:hypothetical protein
MKKVAIALVFALSLISVGCGGGATTSAPVKTSAK